MRTLGRRCYRAGVGSSVQKLRGWEARPCLGMAGDCVVLMLCGFWSDNGDKSKRCKKIGGSSHSYPGVGSVPQAPVPFHIPHLGSGWAFTCSPGP